MLPLTLLAANKVADLLLSNSAFSNAIAAAARENNVAIPNVDANDVVLSSAPPDLGDSVNQFSYPRVCIYCSGVKNSQVEKFRTFSGSVSVVTEIYTSGNFVGDTDRWIHFYVEAFTKLIGEGAGDWGDGLLFAGAFDVQFHPPKRGGFGFIQGAKISCSLTVSR